MPQSRRLAAILFADIVGYTALMQRDEQQALAKLNIFKEQLASQVPIHQGEIIQFYGDGCLVIFDSSVDALTCAKTIQTHFSQEDVPVRIGLHVGDIIQKEGNIFGDAVNIASRVESMGIPGSVLLSSSVRSQVKNQKEFDLINLGRFAFKNVEEDMSVYALSNEGFKIPSHEQLSGKGELVQEERKDARNLTKSLSLGIIGILAAAGIVLTVAFLGKGDTQNTITEAPSIVVLPFDDIGSDADKASFAGGVADEVRMTLSSIDELKVISRNLFQGQSRHP